MRASIAACLLALPIAAAAVTANTQHAASPCEAIATVDEDFTTDPFSGGRFTQDSATPINCPIQYDAINDQAERVATVACAGSEGGIASTTDMGTREVCFFYRISEFTDAGAFEAGHYLFVDTDVASGVFEQNRCESGIAPCNPLRFGVVGQNVDTCTTMGTLAVGDHFAFCVDEQAVRDVYRVWNLGSAAPAHPVDNHGTGWGEPECQMRASAALRDGTGTRFGVEMRTESGAVGNVTGVDRFVAYACAP